MHIPKPYHLFIYLFLNLCWKKKKKKNQQLKLFYKKEKEKRGINKLKQIKE